MVTSLAAAGQLQFKPKLGVFYMLAAILVLGSTDAIVKWSTTNIDPIQIGFSRFVVSLIMVLWLVGGSQPGFAALRTKRPLEHAARAFCAAVELTAFYFAISKIPLPTAMSIVSASPIFGTLLGVVFLRERLRLGGWIAVFAGFAGMLLVVQPEEGANSLIGTIAVLTSVFLWCFAQLFARRLSTTESNLSILFYYAIGGVIILGLATPFVWVNPTPLEWAALLAVGVFGCLGQIVPERVMAACGSPMWGMNQSGVREGGKPYANMFFYNGGMGGNTQRDGVTCLSWPSNVSSTSIEISEHIAPLRFHHKKLRPDSGGPGRHRGGLGQEILIESRSETPIAVSFLAERTIFPAFGIEGGRDGAPGELRINGEQTDPKKQYVVNKGDTVSLGTPGGGGHGDPRQRDRLALEHDVASGYVTDRVIYQ